MAKAFKRGHERGSYLGMVFIFATALILWIAITMSMLNVNASRSNVFVWRDRLYKMANEGYIKSLAQIGVDPSLQGFDNGVHDYPSPADKWGQYQTFAVRAEQILTQFPNQSAVSIPQLSNSIYLVVNSWLTVANVPDPINCRIAMFVNVADAARYFGASKMTWIISPTASADKVDYFGRNIIIRYADGPPAFLPKARNIFYTQSAMMINENNAMTSLASGALTNKFSTTGPFPPLNLPPPAGFGTVTQLTADPAFPQLGQANLGRLLGIATTGVPLGGVDSSFSPGTGVTTVFPDEIVAKGWGSGDHIYPPGCTDADCSNLTTNDQFRNHVYYVDGDLRIRGIVHGQVLFVATGKITITGDLVSESLAGVPTASPASAYDTPAIAYPGCPSPCYADRALNVGREEASVAHQAVLMTPSAMGVSIDNQNIDAAAQSIYLPNDVLNLEALIVAPNGGVSVVNGTPAGPSLKWMFKGALILGAAADTKGKITPFQPSEYMASLAVRPPPYVPCFTQLVFWKEEYY